jgi:Ca2+-binding EF-hand superfamily protein
LLGAKISPSLLFREADKDGDGTIHIKELYVVLIQLGIKLDEQTIEKIF